MEIVAEGMGMTGVVAEGVGMTGMVAEGMGGVKDLSNREGTQSQLRGKLPNFENWSLC